MSRSDFGAGSVGKCDENSIQVKDQAKENDFKTVQLVDQVTVVYKSGNAQNEEDKISMARENPEDSVAKFKLELKTEAEKEKHEMSSKILKTSLLLLLCLLLLNFLLVFFVMNRTSDTSSSLSILTTEFLFLANQTHKIREVFGEVKFELKGIEKWKNSTDEKLESLHVQIEALLNETKVEKRLDALESYNWDAKLQLKNSYAEFKEQLESLSDKVELLESNISSIHRAWPLTPPELRGAPEGNGDQEPKENEEPEKDQVTTEDPEPNKDEESHEYQETTEDPESEEHQETSDPPRLPRSCGDAIEILPSPRSKKQTIYPHGNSTTMEVLCDFETAGGGWTIIQKRSSGPKEEFKQNWNEYKNGFGSLDKNFWLGLENIRALTKNGDQELRIELEDFDGGKRWAKYSSFSVSDASDFYKLTLGGFSGDSTLQDDMAYVNGQRFSTTDQDNDYYPGVNCALEYGGGAGWWFGGCAFSNLNGLYFEKGETVPNWEGIFWDSWKGWDYSLAKTEMKIRERKP